MVTLCDTLDASTTARICADGSLVAEVRGARTGIQLYSKSDTGAPADFAGDSVRVYRPAEEVFSRDSLASFAAAPVTINHPSEMVDASNWKRHGVGEINGDIARDGEFVRVPLIVRDAAAVEKVRTTHKQLSMGYTCTLDWTPGTTPSGEAYDAVQREIRINHIAAVPAARGGPELKISDERTPLHLLTDGIGDAKAWLKKAIALHKKHMDGTAPTTGPAGEKSQMLMMEQMENALAALDGESPASRMKMDFNPKEPPMKIKIGDAEVDATNGEAVRIAVDGLNTKLADAQTRATKAETDLAAATTAVAAKDAEIVTLNQKLADSEITPAKLRDAAKAYANVCGKAKAVGVTFAEDADSDTIMKAVVDAKMGDAAKGWSADQIAASFAVLTKDAKSEAPAFDGAAFKGGIRNLGDAQAAEHQAWADSNDHNAWRRQSAA